jgi:NAD(P)H-hydrate epimerase
VQIPAISALQMKEVDRLMIDEYGIQLIQMMENAGRNLAELARMMLGGSVYEKRIAVLCGPGNNGGGGMVAARHLHNWGADIKIKLLVAEKRLKDIPAHQYDILKCIRILDSEILDLSLVDLTIDAMIGYGLTGDPHGGVAEWIRRANASARPTLALDVPSGLNATTGTPGDPCIRATATMTLALPKTGLVADKAEPYIGKLYLADISVPPELYSSLGIAIRGIFSNGAIIKIDRGMIGRMVEV